jgi:hypothetical protein
MKPYHKFFRVHHSIVASPHCKIAIEWFPHILHTISDDAKWLTKDVHIKLTFLKHVLNIFVAFNIESYEKAIDKWDQVGSA